MRSNEARGRPSLTGLLPKPSSIVTTPLHLADLALACACAMGREDAWDHL